MADLQVVITGKDGVSRIFQEISQSAKAAGDDVEKAGRDGADGLKKIDRAADDAERSLADVGDTAKRTAVDFDAVGAAAVAVGGFLTVAGNSAIDQMQIMDGLRQQFGDAADEYIAFADTIASNSIFNDDDIMRGMQYFSVLREQYGLTDQQLRELMQTTADLATVRGTTFEDASSRITGAIRGEAEASEYLGLSLQQSAIDHENLTLTMNNQERAQFQLSALNEQAAYAQGAASAALESDVGKRAALTNAIQDNTQAVGNFVGPYNAMIAGMATGAVGIAQFAGGFGALAGALRTATTAGAAFVASPIGLTVTALGAAVAVATGMFLNHKRATAEAAAEWEAANQSGQDLTNTINQMTLAGDTFGARFARSLQEGLAGQVDWYTNMLTSVLDGTDTSSTFYQSIVGMMEQAGLDMGPAGAAARLEFVQGLMPTADDEIALNSALTDLFSLFSNPNIDQAELQRNMQAIFQQFDDAPDGSVTIDQLTTSYEALYDTTILALESTEQLAGGMTNLAGNTLTATEALFVGSGAVAQLALGSEEASAQLDALNLSITSVTTAAGILGTATEQMTSDMDTFALSLLDAAKGANAAAIELAAYAAQLQAMGGAATAGALDAVAAASDKAAERVDYLLGLLVSVTGIDNPLSAINATGLATSSSILAENLTDASAAADDLFRVIVGNTNAIVSQADATLSWAEELINVRGELGKIDDLLGKKLIDRTQYDAAQNAYDSIAISTAAIGDNLAAVQAIQSPLLAESQAQLAAYTAELLEMPAAQQLVALGWMDSATAAKAFEVQALAASAAAGELGPNGEAAVTQYIDSIVRAEPATAALLEQLGLITDVVRDSSGMILSYSVDLTGAEEANDILTQLNDTLQMLTDVLDDGQINGSINIEDNATPKVQEALEWTGQWDDTESEADLTANNSSAIASTSEAQDAANTFDATTATATINVNDMASGVIAGALGALMAIDGYAANATVTTTYVRKGVGPTERHGGIAGYALGGNVVPIWAGEAGPEILHFAGGGSALIPHEGLYGVPSGAYIEPANSVRSRGDGGRPVQVIIQGSVITERELIAKAAEAIWAAEVEEDIQYQLAMGVAS